MPKDMDRALRRHHLARMVRRALEKIKLWHIRPGEVKSTRWEDGVKHVEYYSLEDVRELAKKNAEVHCRGCSCHMCQPDPKSPRGRGLRGVK